MSIENLKRAYTALEFAPLLIGAAFLLAVSLYYEKMGIEWPSSAVALIVLSIIAKRKVYELIIDQTEGVES